MHAQHVVHRDVLSDADDERHLGLDRLDNGRRRARSGHKDGADLRLHLIDRLRRLALVVLRIAVAYLANGVENG